MTSPAASAWTSAIVLAALGDSDGTRAEQALSALGIAAELCYHPSHAFASLSIRDGNPLLVVIGTPGFLPLAVLIHAARSLPGRGELPVIAVGGSVQTLPGPVALLPRPLDTDALAAVVRDPAWVASPPPAIVTPIPTRPIPPTPVPPTIPAGAGPLILVVDDAPTNLAVACQLLRYMGYRAVPVASGAEALAAVASTAFDLILMDCMMPEMDGMQTTAELRRREAASSRRIPIIAVTANGAPGAREACLAAGMDDFVLKPVQSGSLGAAIRHWLALEPKPGSDPELPVVGQAGPPVLLDPAPLAQFERIQAGASLSLIDAYLAELATAEPAIAAAMAGNDLAATGALCHKLKGASLTLGAQALGAALKTQERKAKAGESAFCHEHWPVVRSLLRDTRDLLTSIRARSLPPAVVEPPPPRWDDRFLTGDRRIDDDHRRLFRLIADFAAVQAAGRGDEAVVQVLIDLTKYAIDHFTGEEDLMRRHAYPGLPEHARHHAQMTERLKLLIDTWRASRAVPSATLAGFLGDWLADHILAHDLRLFDWLPGGGRPRPGR